VHNPHFWAILDGAEQEARLHGYSLILATTSMQRERERQAFDALASQHLDGLILLFTYPEDFANDIARLRQKGLPVVVDGAMFNDVDRVWFHYRAAARELMDHLFSLGWTPGLPGRKRPHRYLPPKDGSAGYPGCRTDCGTLREYARSWLRGG
jgi:DNA-binding LacI/PurR family transcriptional regulator